jgi:hypothetical protein
MAMIDVTKTELVWPGKYHEDGTLREAPRVSLPFQVIETVNESRATLPIPIRRAFTMPMGGAVVRHLGGGREGDQR